MSATQEATIETDWACYEYTLPNEEIRLDVVDRLGHVEDGAGFVAQALVDGIAAGALPPDPDGIKVVGVRLSIVTHQNRGIALEAGAQVN